MKEFLNKINFLIKENKESLLDSHLKYGGVNLVKLEMGKDETSLEIELDNGNLAFTILVNNNGCIDCGCDEFNARQVCRLDIIVDSNNNFVKNFKDNVENSIYDSEEPYGPYSCSSCNKEYDDLNSLGGNISKVHKLLHERLKEEGIGVYLDNDSFEESVYNYHNKP